MPLDEVGLKAIIEGYSQFNSQINQMAVSMGNVDKSLVKIANTSAATAQKQDKVAQSTRKLADEYGGVTAKAISFNQISMVANQVMDVATKVFAATAQKAMDYGVQVRGLAMYTGMTTEETSKLIQVSDDLKVEFNTLEMAAKFMFKNGLQPSVETLAKLSDQYLAIGDPLQKAEFLTKNFGRAGIDMAEAMNRGGAAIRAMGDSINPALILTKEQAQAAEDARAAQDNFNDAIMAVSVSIGNNLLPAITGVMPPLVKFIELFGEGLNVIKMFADFTNNLADAFANQNRELIVGSTSYADYYAKAKMLENQAARMGLAFTITAQDTYELVVATKDITRETDGWVNTLRTNTTEAGRAKIATTGLSDVTVIAAKNTEKFTQNTTALYNDMFMYNQAAITAKSRTEQNAIAMEDAAEAALLYSSALSGALGKEMKAFEKSTAALDKDLDSVNQRIDALQVKKIKSGLTKAEKEELEGLLVKLEDIKQQYKDNADAHAEATKRIILDIISQRLALGGTSDAERDYLQKLQLALGLVDKATYDAMVNAGKLADALAQKAAAELLPLGEARDLAIAAADEAIRFASSLLGIPDVSVNVDVWYRTHGHAPTGGGASVEDTFGSWLKSHPGGTWEEWNNLGRPERAGGGMVDAGALYRVGERGEEWFRPQSNGVIIPNNVVRNYSNSIANQNKTTKNYNLSVITNQSQSAVTSSFGIMRLIG